MTTSPLSTSDLKALKALDTPTVCNCLELLIPQRRGWGLHGRSADLFLSRSRADGWGMPAPRPSVP